MRAVARTAHAPLAAVALLLLATVSFFSLLLALVAKPNGSVVASGSGSVGRRLLGQRLSSTAVSIEETAATAPARGPPWSK